MLTETDSPTDEELVNRCWHELPANTRSYEMLVQRYMHRVYSIVYRIVSNREEAEDITQEVFIKVFNNIKRFEQQSSFSSWLYRIATNSALDHLDKLKRQQKHTARSFIFRSFSAQEQEEEKDPLSLLNLHPSTEAGPEESSMQRELRECISRVLKQLDRQQASLIIMRDFDDLSYDEIAKTLKVGLSAVKMRIHRARLAFQELFARMCESYLFSMATPKGKGNS